MNIHDQSGSTNATATLAASKEMFYLSQTSLVSSSKVEDIEEESLKRKENISGIRIIDVNVLSGMYSLVICYLCPMCECSSYSSLWKI